MVDARPGILLDTPVWPWRIQDPDRMADPARARLVDRLLVARARPQNAPIVTVDPGIHRDDVEVPAAT